MPRSVSSIIVPKAYRDGVFQRTESNVIISPSRFAYLACMGKRKEFGNAPVAFRVFDFKSIEDSGICRLSVDGIQADCQGTNSLGQYTDSPIEFPMASGGSFRRQQNFVYNKTTYRDVGNIPGIKRPATAL
jgi:hypothetical protein